MPDVGIDGQERQPRRVRQLLTSRASAYGAVAALCFIAGVGGSVLGARSVAHRDSRDAARAFQSSSAEVVSRLDLALQREQDLTTAAAAFLAGHPQASSAQFKSWVKWAGAPGAYPELGGLTVVGLVFAGPPAVPAVRAGVHVPAAKTVVPARTVPLDGRLYRCFAATGFAAGARGRASAGLGCRMGRALLSARDSARQAVRPRSGSAAIEVDTPVYRDGSAPSAPAARRGAFVGWVRELISPREIAGAALKGFPGYGVILRYGSGASGPRVTAGNGQASGQSSTSALPSGWSVRVSAPAAGTDTLADGDALALLILGVLASGLLAALVFVLARRRDGHPAEHAAQAQASPREELYDPLTRLPNRLLTLDLAERMLARAGRQSGMLAGALLIDVDWFKDLNEKLGAYAGDQALGIVAERLQAAVRTGDTVGRLEGDRFLVLVEAQARGVRLESLAERIVEALHKPLGLEGFGPSFCLTASIGIAYGRYTATDELLHDARLALDASKAAGKDRFTLFNANMRSVIEDRGVLEAEMNTALAERQFFLLYEPVYDLANGKVVALEALLRWRHPSRGVMMPGEFAALAEETGLTVPIGRWMLEEACTRAAAWNVAGHRVAVSVDVSANQLNRDGFGTDVRRALQQSGIEPALLTLQVGEATVMGDIAAVAGRLDEVKQLGVKVAVDNFGNGYAYRSDLQRLPLDFLKVDRGSLAASDDEDYRSWLLEAILLFARDLSLTVIARGVSTAEQLATLKQMNCPLGQGSLLSRPTAAEDVERLLGSPEPGVAAALGIDPYLP